ncbi:MAG: anthranilate phosphoribosyltransferase [Planctomycetaceae bacterium]
MTTIQQALDQLVAGLDLDNSLAYAVFCAIMDGQASEVEVAALLTALRVKGEAVSEIAGAARAMQERATPIATKRQALLDTCGTGGDELSTFNISTATALVVAACGVAVAKHGNRSVSSSSGSADVLEQFGVNINLPADKVARCVDELQIGFCFAPLFHTAMRNVAPVRRQLRFRTIFNLVGPLTNPARASYQLLGAGRKEIAHRLARALAALGRKHACVVCGADQLDEVSLWGTTVAFEVTGSLIVERHWTAETFGLPECRVEDLQVHSPSESCAMIREVFDGRHGGPRDMVLANAAAGLLAAEREVDPRRAVDRAAQAIDSGGARDLLQRLCELTQRLGAEGT